MTHCRLNASGSPGSRSGIGEAHLPDQLPSSAPAPAAMTSPVRRKSLHQLGGGSLGLIIVIPGAQSLKLVPALSQHVAKPAGASTHDVSGNETD